MLGSAAPRRSSSGSSVVGMSRRLRALPLHAAPSRWLAVPTGRGAKVRRGFGTRTPGLAGTRRPVQLPAATCRRLATASAASEANGALRFVPTSIRRFTLQYGLNFVGIYLGVYWVTLLGIYSVITSCVIAPRDMVRYIESAVNTIGGLAGVPLADYLHMSDINPDAAPLMVAWMLAKPTEPPRLVLSAAITPRCSQWVRTLRTTPADGHRALRYVLCTQRISPPSCAGLHGPAVPAASHRFPRLRCMVGWLYQC